MPLNPNERVPGPPIVYDDLTKVPSVVKLPPGVDRKSKDWYVQAYTTKDGRTFYEVYKRGGKAQLPDGSYPPDQVTATVEGPVNQDQADRFKKEQDAAEKGAPTVTIGGVPHSVAGQDENGRDIYAPVQTAGGSTAAAQTPAQQNETALNNERSWHEQQGHGRVTHEEYRQTQRQEQLDADARAKDQRAQAEKDKPQLVPGTLNTTSPRMGVWDPATQTVTWAPNENYQNPSPKPITLPNTRTIFWDDGNGTIRQEKNTAYVKPSKLVPNPSDPRKWVNVTEDDNGNPVILPVDDKTTIKPADLPVLQAKFGEISQGLGQLAQDLNSRVARGEITPEERKQAFEAAHAQASTQVAEINSILENSKAIWSGQVQQRGQSLAETQSRRSFASDAAGRAIQTGMSIATSAGPGHGQAIAAGVRELMGMQQRYAQGMGGFRESPEVGLPPALEQARGMSIPGFGPNAGMPPSPPPPPSGANVDATNAAAMAGSRAAFGGLGIPPVPSAPAPPPSGISNATDAGGVPRAYSPASSTVGSGLPPGVAGMGASLGAADGYGGAPVAAGGAGVWNPDATVQGMLGDGSDPAWEEAVRRAAQAHAQQGYGR